MLHVYNEYVVPQNRLGLQKYGVNNSLISSYGLHNLFVSFLPTETVDSVIGYFMRYRPRFLCPVVSVRKNICTYTIYFRDPTGTPLFLRYGYEEECAFLSYENIVRSL